MALHLVTSYPARAKERLNTTMEEFINLLLRDDFNIEYLDELGSRAQEKLLLVMMLERAVIREV